MLLACKIYTHPPWNWYPATRGVPELDFSENRNRNRNRNFFENSAGTGTGTGITEPEFFLYKKIFLEKKFSIIFFKKIFFIKTFFLEKKFSIIFFYKNFFYI